MKIKTIKRDELTGSGVYLDDIESKKENFNKY